MLRGMLAGVIAATLLLPAVGSVAGPEDERRNVHSRLKDIKSNLNRDTARAADLRSELRALDASLTELQKEMARLNSNIDEVQRDVRDAQARIDVTQERIDRIQGLAIDQAVALYKSGETNVLDVLLRSESLTELNERVEMLGAAAQENTGALVRYGRLRVTIRTQREDLFDKRDKLQARLDERSEIAAEQQAQQKKFDEKLAQLEGRIADGKNTKNRLEGRLENLDQQILEAQAKSEVAALGTSKKGFIWPLNGSVTSPYGPRWGRMHTGIDINGYYGQPVVATKEGQVVMSSSYSGYGNTVVVDHGGGYATLYAHLSSFNVSTGSYVEQGKVVGYVGCTGSCTGDHLHFEVRINGDPVDPMPYLP
jgi:murein DD-endopeptidase MepM/ murein hydrolase activator NlpD